jgi:hypothetical protein
VYRGEAGRATYGKPVGIIMHADSIPRPPGDVGNATTFSFPVSYKVVRNYDMWKLRQPDVLDAGPFVEAAKELERDGARAIVGGCGFFSILQTALTEAVSIPVFSSSLIQVPLAYRTLRGSRKVGIITADSSILDDRYFRPVGWTARDIPVVIAGIEDNEHIDLRHTEITEEVLRQRAIGLAGVARDLIGKHPEIGALVLECSNLPPYSWAAQEAVGLPVFDFSTLANLAYDTVARPKFNGLM